MHWQFYTIHKRNEHFRIKDEHIIFLTFTNFQNVYFHCQQWIGRFRKQYLGERKSESEKLYVIEDEFNDVLSFAFSIKTKPQHYLESTSSMNVFILCNAPSKKNSLPFPELWVSLLVNKGLMSDHLGGNRRERGPGAKVS